MKSKILARVLARARSVFQNPIGVVTCITPILLGTISLIIESFGVDVGMKNVQNSWVLISLGVFSFIACFIFEIITDSEDTSKNTKN